MSSPQGASLSDRFRHNEQVVSSRLGDTGVLVHLRTNRIFELNETGIRIWELIGQGLPVGDIVAALPKEFEIDESSARAQTGALLDALEREGLIDADGG